MKRHLIGFVCGFGATRVSDSRLPRRRLPATSCPVSEPSSDGTEGIVMNKNKTIGSALLAVSLVALAGCEGPVPPTKAAVRPARPEPPAAAVIGVPIVIAITADTTATDESSRSEAHELMQNVIQHGQRIDHAVSFPTDFEYELVGTVHEWSHQFPHSDISQEVLDRGAIVPWVSVDDGNSWYTGTFDFHTFTLRVSASVGSVTIFVTTWHHQGKQGAVDLVQLRLAQNKVLVRLLVLRATGD